MVTRSRTATHPTLRKNNGQPAPHANKPNSSTWLREELARIRSSIAAIDPVALGMNEAGRQLRLQQESVMRGVIRAIEDASLPPMPDVIGDGRLLPAWERLAEHLRVESPT